MGYHQHHRQMLDDPYYTETVARLRQARENAGLSQRDLAKVVNVRWESVSAWERERTIPSLYHFLEWCKALNFEMTGASISFVGTEAAAKRIEELKEKRS